VRDVKLGPNHETWDKTTYLIATLITSARRHRQASGDRASAI
jgi:hypothetical protein